MNEHSPEGVFTPGILGRVFRLTEHIKKIDGVITREIIAPSTKDNIRQDSPGSVRFEWLMPSPPETAAAAEHVRREAMDNPLFRGTMVSEDGKALCIYVPIEKKSYSYRISRDIQSFIAGYRGEESYHITGLPVAEDTFGVMMFRQMMISAPLAGLVIFLLMLLFFRKVALILSPMLVALATVVITMGALIGRGFTVHIMSSMIPIFLMPIAVVDSVHILSEFFDHYREIGNRRDTILTVMNTLFLPMLFTSLTTTVGFASLAFTPIPPVRVFGIFVAGGVMVAWLLTVLFMPAYVMLLPEGVLANYGAVKGAESKNRFNTLLEKAGSVATHRWKPIIGSAIFIIAVSVAGISRIQINDNPVKWFEQRHPIRIADEVLNAHFGGTYTAYLVLEAEDDDAFKEPALLRYVERLKEAAVTEGNVGKVTALSDVVKKVYYELLGGDKEYFRIPGSRRAVAQCLMSFQNSHKPDDLWHFATPDYRKIAMWFQLQSGDNRDMEAVTRFIDDYIEDNAPPVRISYRWAGLTYINVVWQDKMVRGMLKSLLGSFVIVFFMMMFLFRSPALGGLSMIPLSVTIVFIYGLIGLVGKDYDMPVAVLSSLTLGLSVDFAIHFLERARAVFAKNGSWNTTAAIMFKEPARAIARNAVIISVGFTPLLLAPLVPYKTVGFFFATIMAVSGCATLLLLPAIIAPRAALFLSDRKRMAVCSRAGCVIISTLAAVAVAGVLQETLPLHWSLRTAVIVCSVILLMVVCHMISRRYCKG